MREKNKKKIEKGARNLVVLGVLSTVVALTTTGVALAIYHNSGDIYLDRSRPGFLPDEEEIQQDEGEREDDDYVFQKDTVLDTEKMDEFLEKLQEEIDAINAYEKPFGEEVLSDERLGIPTTESAAGKNE
ncbi:hypothetical protein IKE99_02355 [Candidatus Saccharibacteria bacterium]|nr:hypothetical protein [Candidatus Saccharibacteria bacterium]